MIMRKTPALLAALSVLLIATGPRAQDAKELARRTQIVARIGDRRITAGELEDKLAGVPRMQLSEFGSTPEEIRRKLCERHSQNCVTPSSRRPPTTSTS